MRIRKGQRCLPLAPAEFQAGCGGLGKGGPDGAMVAVAADDMIGRRGPQYQERANDTSMERNECLEHDLEKNRVSADDNFNESSLMVHDSGVDATVTKPAEIPSEERSLFSRHTPHDTSWTVSSSTISATETRDQVDLLEQSLHHVCASAGMSGLSARDAVAQIIEQGLPGLNAGGAKLIDQVTKSFRHSPKFVECKVPGRYVLQDSPARNETKMWVLEDSGISNNNTVSSSDVVEVAKQLQDLQKSRSFSLGSGDVELSDQGQSVDGHARSWKAVANSSEELAKESEGGEDNYEDVTATNRKARSKSRKVMQCIDQLVSRCKRDDGKGWRCSFPAEARHTMCTHHRKRAVSQGQGRGTKRKFYSDSAVSAKRPPSDPIYVANSRVLPDVVTPAAATSWSPFLDEELAHDEHRQFLKAKSMKLILLSKPPRKNSHTRRRAV
ncbi:hypothetical protein M758_12G085400 [Ceratodon purpureus]|nr:hypothetical protein M758_12G085400 [Ceratodon purpureus]